jgi:hypothetical protein
MYVMLEIILPWYVALLGIPLTTESVGLTWNVRLP